MQQKFKDSKANVLKSVQIELTYQFYHDRNGPFFCNGCLQGTIHILREHFQGSRGVRKGQLLVIYSGRNMLTWGGREVQMCLHNIWTVNRCLLRKTFKSPMHSLFDAGKKHFYYRNQACMKKRKKKSLKRNLSFVKCDLILKVF